MVLMSLSREHQLQLLEIAKKSIAYGLNSGTPFNIELDRYPSELIVVRASFVTLQKHGQLRGCIGMLEAVRPLVQDVAENAFAAAFKDPRFPKLTAEEFDDLDVHISILSPSEPIIFTSEQDLINQIRPGIDGLILQEGYKRGTFLPSVWESLTKPEQFLQHLKQKAGLPENHWSETIKVSRYTTEMIE